ncbi:MAG: C25 family cysteine peptidase [Promethearchaeota archaeon]
MFKLSSKKSCYLLFVLFIILPSVILNCSLFEGTISNSYIHINVLADNPPDVNMRKLPDIPYDELNEMWYDPKIEMLIITPDGNQAFVNACKPLMEWNNERGVKTIILSNFTQYPGRDNPERIRNMIKSYYKNENIRWVLLAGDAQSDLIPIRYVYNPDVQRWGQGQTEDVGSQTLKPTDFYYADLTGNWNEDGDSYWGEAPKDNANEVDEIDWIPEVYVGRLPASTAEELEIMVNKTLNYERNPELGDWMNHMLLAGGVSDTKEEEPPDGEDESRLTNYIIQNYVKSEMNYTHLCRSETFIPPEPVYDLNSTSFINRFNEGYSTVIFAGHGALNIFADVYDTYYSSGNANSCTNFNKTSLVYSSACTTSAYDVTDNSIGEILIKKNNSGAIGYIGALRISWYFTDDKNLEELNRGNAKLFWKEFFQNKKFQQGMALYDSKVAYIESDYFTEGSGSLDNDFERKQLLTYCLLGDPEVDIYTNKPVNASNPFIQDIYEGQLITTTIKDIKGKTVPYARVHLKTSDGKYRTIYGDIHGTVSFRLPAQANERYNVTITGHNLIPSYFNFTTLSDNNKPDFIDEKCTPENPTVSDNICFDIEVRDSQSGIENVYLLKSKDKDFEQYTYYKMVHRFEDDKDDFKYTINKLDPGKYYFLVVARDWANNKKILEDKSFEILIPVPIMYYVLIISLIMIIALVGISVIIAYNGKKRYLHMLNRLELT